MALASPSSRALSPFLSEFGQPVDRVFGRLDDVLDQVAEAVAQSREGGEHAVTDRDDRGAHGLDDPDHSLAGEVDDLVRELTGLLDHGPHRPGRGVEGALDRVLDPVEERRRLRGDPAEEAAGGLLLRLLALPLRLLLALATLLGRLAFPFGVVLGGLALGLLLLLRDLRGALLRLLGGLGLAALDDLLLLLRPLLAVLSHACLRVRACGGLLRRVLAFQLRRVLAGLRVLLRDLLVVLALLLGHLAHALGDRCLDLAALLLFGDDRRSLVAGGLADRGAGSGSRGFGAAALGPAAALALAAPGGNVGGQRLLRDVRVDLVLAHRLPGLRLGSGVRPVGRLLDVRVLLLDLRVAGCRVARDVGRRSRRDVETRGGRRQLRDRAVHRLRVGLAEIALCVTGDVGDGQVVDRRARRGRQRLRRGGRALTRVAGALDLVLAVVDRRRQRRRRRRAAGRGRAARPRHRRRALLELAARVADGLSDRLRDPAERREQLRRRQASRRGERVLRLRACDVRRRRLRLVLDRRAAPAPAAGRLRLGRRLREVGALGLRILRDLGRTAERHSSPPPVGACSAWWSSWPSSSSESPGGGAPPPPRSRRRLRRRRARLHRRHHRRRRPHVPARSGPRSARAALRSSRSLADERAIRLPREAASVRSGRAAAARDPRRPSRRRATARVRRARPRRASDLRDFCP